jgi:hypothetical protein
MSRLLTLYLFFFDFAVAYFAITHYRLGNLLGQHLDLSKNEALKHAMSEYIDVACLGEYSNWADRVKRKPQYAWSKHHHYIDLPSEWCETPKRARGDWKDMCRDDYIITSVLNITNDLRYNRDYLSRSDVTERLYFLVHHLQDFAPTYACVW